MNARDSRATNDSYATGVRSGLVAMSPLVFAIAPFTTAMAVAAHSAGFEPLETTMMSMFVFAGAAQMAAISLYAGGAGLLTIALTTFLINLRHIVYGLSLDRHLPPGSKPSRPVLAFLLIDESYGLTIAQHASRSRPDAFYLGTSLGMYLTFVLFTGIGAVFASFIPDIHHIGLDFIFPLAFVGLLMPLLRGMEQIVTALIAGMMMLILSQALSPGVAIPLAIVSGAIVSTVWKDNA